MNTTTMRLSLALAISTVALGFVLAGNLDPPGPPAPTMVTLQQIYDGAHPVDTCFNNVGRFVDCGNGTVKDTVSHLIWLKNANCLGLKTWADANIAAALLGQGTSGGIACGLTDGSKPGDWRLPTLQCPSGASCPMSTPPNGEFASIFAPSCLPPHILNTAGTGCWSEGNPFSGVQSDNYWPSTTYASGPNQGWRANLNTGFAATYFKDGTFYVWPVRGGP